MGLVETIFILSIKKMVKKRTISDWVMKTDHHNLPKAVKIKQKEDDVTT